MNKIRFGKTGLQITQLGLGSAQIGLLKVEQERAHQILHVLLDSGINLIDTAASYRGSEQSIGESVSHRRKEFVLVSKCGGKVSNIDAPEWSASLIEQTIERSLKALRTDVIDVMLLHSCDEQTLRKGEAVAALVKARDAGKIRFAGYSGDNEAAAYAATLPDIAVIETSISLADQVNIDGVLAVARKNDLGVLAKRPIANACWKMKNEQQGFYGDYASVYHDRLKKMGIQPADFGLTGESAWVDLALRFTLSLPGVHAAIIGTTNPENAKRNIQSVSKGPLAADVVERIRQAYETARAGANWPGQT